MLEPLLIGAAVAAAFLAGLFVGLFEQRLRRRRPRACGFQVDREEGAPLFI